MVQNYFLRWMGVGASIFIIWLLFPFLKSFCVALLLAMAVIPLHRMIELKIERISLVSEAASISASVIVTLALSLIIFLPIMIFFFHVLNHPSDTIGMIRLFESKLDTITSYLPSYLAWAKEPLDGLMVLAKSHKNEIMTAVVAWLGNGLKNFVSMLGEMAMIVVFFFFLTWYGRRLLLFLLPIIPLGRSIKREFIEEMTMTTAVVFYTLLGVMVAQGLAFGIFIAFFDGYSPLLLGVLTGFSAIVPIFGTALIWIPVAVNEYLEGNVANAVIISLYSWAMMAFFIDNIVKLVILNFVNKALSDGKRRINEFVIFFAIVGGLATFGFWGVILGPAMLAFAVTTLRTLRKTNRLMSR